MAEYIIAGIMWLGLMFLLAWGVGRFIEEGMYDNKEDKE